MTPCILVVALGASVHTQRWLQMVASPRHRLVLLSSTPLQPNLPALAALPTIRSREDLDRLPPGMAGQWARDPLDEQPADDDLPPPVFLSARAPLVRSASVEHAVRVLQPVLVHSMEIQMAGYACLKAAQAMGTDFPLWLVSNWGSDLYLYEKLDTHRPVLQALAARVDALHCECARDVAMAQQLGYREGCPTHVQPASGGVDFADMPLPGTPPSQRNLIVIKGYHGWSGRALHILSALLIAAPHLQRFQVRIALAGPEVAEMAAEVARVTGLDIQPDTWQADHGPALDRTAQARLVVGVGISDGIGTSSLEAMALGAFPIAADTGCLCEWIRPGIDGLIVDPHDVAALADAIVTAATDDALVDAAYRRNRQEVEKRWDARTNGARALRMYDDVIARGCA